jgi:hypothetical protein
VIPKAINSAPTSNNPGSFVSLARLLVPANCLCLDFIVYYLTNNSPRVANVHTEKFLAKSQNTDTSAARESDVDRTVKQLFVAVQKGVVERDAALICV